MQFHNFGDFINYVLTAPGFVWNWIVHGLWLLFYQLPVLLYHCLVAIAKFIFFLPVFVWKVAVWFWTFFTNMLNAIYDYLFFRDWTWADLGTFPALRSSSVSEIMLEGIDKPFNRFAGDVSIFLKEITEPLILAMGWITDQLGATPWVFLFPAIVGLVWVTSRNRGVVLISVVALAYIGLLGMTDPAYQTIALMVVSILICVAIGVPLGILMAFSDVLERMIKPLLDIMQTMPSFVYLIPVLILFGVSDVAGLIAVFIYAMPPVIRLTNLGIRLVAFDVIEAANAFGATYRQRLTGVLLPLALPNIFAGINQTIMMALAMVVIAALVGAAGLGQFVLQAQSNTLFGRGLQYGFAIVLIAIVIDRTFHSVGERMQEHRTVGH